MVANGSWVDVEEAAGVALHEGYVGVAADEDVGFMEVDEATGGGVIVRRCPCNVGDGDSYTFADKRVALRVIIAYILAIDIAVNGSKPLKGSELLRYLEVSDVSCVPYFITILKVGEDLSW